MSPQRGNGQTEEVDVNSGEDDLQVALQRQPGWLSACFPMVTGRKPSSRRRDKGPNEVQATNEVHMARMCTPSIIKAVASAQGRNDTHGGLSASQRGAAMAALTESPEEKPTVEDLFVSRQLHVRVISAKGLNAVKSDGTSDPFVCVRIADETFRTAVAKRRLDATYSDAFAFPGECLRMGNYIVELEVWSLDEWHYDDFLGQAEIDLRQVPLHLDSRPVSCTAKLYVLQRNGKKEKRDFGEVQVVVWSTPENAKEQYMSPGQWFQNITPEVMSLCAPRKRLPSVQIASMGTLYEEPCIAYIKVSLVGISGLYEALGKRPPPMVCPTTGKVMFTLTGRTSLVAQTTSSRQDLRSEATSSSFDDSRTSASMDNNAVVGGKAAQFRDKMQSMLPIVKFQKWRPESLGSSNTAPTLGWQLGWGAMASGRWSNGGGDGSVASGGAKGSARLRKNLMKSMRSVGHATRRRTSKNLPALPEFFFDELEGAEDDMGTEDDGRLSENVVEEFDGHPHPPSMRRVGSPAGHSSPQLDFSSWGSGEVDVDKHAQARSSAANDGFGNGDRWSSTAGDRLTSASAGTGTISGGSRRVSGSGAPDFLRSSATGNRRRGSYDGDVDKSSRGGGFGGGFSGQAAGGSGGSDGFVGVGGNGPSSPRGATSSGSWEGYSSVNNSASSNVQSGNQFGAVGLAGSARSKPLPFVYFKLSYAKQVFRSRLKRVNASGDTAHDESFVFATVRPLESRPLEVNVYICSDRTRKGRLISRTSYEMNDLLRACDAAPRTAPPGQPSPDVIKNTKFADEFALPVLRRPLEHLQGQLRLHVGLADADYRAEMYHVPLVDPGDIRKEPVVRRDSLKALIVNRVFSVPEAAVPRVGSGNNHPDPRAGSSDTASPQQQHQQQPPARFDSSDAVSQAITADIFGAANKAQGNLDLEDLRQFARKGAFSSATPLSLASELSDADAMPNSAASAHSAVSLAASDADSAWARETRHRSAFSLFSSPLLYSALRSSGSLKQLFSGPSRAMPASREASASGPSVAAPPPAAAKPQMIPIGTLIMHCESVDMTLPNLTYFAVIKFGPHWLQTRPRHSGATSTSHFEMRLPIYDPSDTLTVFCFTIKTGPLLRKSKREIVPFCRTIIPLSALPMNAEVRRVNATVREYSDDGEPRTYEEGQSGYGVVTACMRMKVIYTDKARLIQSYVVRPPRPPSWYVLGLDEADQQVIEKQYRKIVSRWLESCSSPLPASCIKLVLASERDRFQMSVLMGNWRRVVQGLEWLLLLRDGLTHIMSWNVAWHSLLAYCLILCGCFFTTPVVSILIGAACLSIWGQRHRAHNQAKAAAAAALDADGEVEDDEDVVAPTNNPYTELKRKYEEIVGLALMVQNYLDDTACFLERLQSMHNWQDFMSTALFTAVLAVAGVAIYILGLPMVLCAVLMWVLRPPALRDPEPTPIQNYFGRLPTAQVIKRVAHLIAKPSDEAPAAMTTNATAPAATR